MKILGICGGFHDASAALLVDGELVAMAEEERFCRSKHAFERWPDGAAEWCLKHAGLEWGEIDWLAYYHDLDRIIEDSPRVEPYRSCFGRRPDLHEKFAQYFRAKQRELEEWARERGLRVRMVDHHDTHLAGAYFGAGYERANVLSVDARGETATAVLAWGEKGHIERITHFDIPHSVGMLYTSVTGFLGYPMFDGEGTVMGLAPYGEPKHIALMQEVLKITTEGIEAADGFLFQRHVDSFLDLANRWEEKLGPVRPYRPDPRDGTDEHIAASVQAHAEDLLIHLASLAHARTGSTTFCLSGGFALNAKANGRLWEQPFCERLYITPAANDAGSALGAAQWLHHDLTGEHPGTVNHVYWGPAYGPTEIDAALAGADGVRVRECEDTIGKTAELLAAGKTVGWFEGAMEVAPRALGHRSILADPRRAEMKDTVNERVKHREPWRPFAASILDEYMEEYLESPSEALFMIVCHAVREAWQERLAATVHVDGTTRPQRVLREQTPRYYELIRRFGNLTGVYALLNTSFNRRGEPIVMTPTEAVDMFVETDLDALVLENTLVEK